MNKFCTQLLVGSFLVAVTTATTHLVAQSILLDVTIPPGANFDKAEFRLWLPPGVSRVDATVVIVPGSNGDWRNMVSDTAWQAFAVRNKLALVGCRFTDKPHDESFIEAYVDVSKGSGQALIDALASFAKTSNHAELAAAPFLMWGMSAGGQFNYEFAAWQPSRVAAFVVNKGGIYYTALTSKATRNVPAILFTGGADLESRVKTIEGLFTLNRRGNALWGFAQQPGVGHVVGKSQAVTMVFFEDVLPMRIGGAPDGATQLKPLVEKEGFVADAKTKTFRAASAGPLPAYPVAWFPTERVAKAWLDLISEKEPNK